MRDVLKAKYDQQMSESEKKNKGPERFVVMKPKVLDNIYQYLDAEEPAVVSNPTPKYRSNITDTASNIKHRKEISMAEIEETDKIMEVWYFFKDQHDTINFVKSVWEAYRYGKMNLPIICYLTDYAVTLMTRASDALVTEYPGFKDMQDIEAFLGFEKMCLGSSLIVFACREQKTKAVGQRDADLHDLFCIKASSVLFEFRENACNPIRAANAPEEARNKTSLFVVILMGLVDQI